MQCNIQCIIYTMMMILTTMYRLCEIHQRARMFTAAVFIIAPN